MRRSGPVTEAEASRILELVRGGATTREAGRAVGRDSKTISNVARRAGVALDASRTAAAEAARRGFDEIRQLELLNRLVAAIHEKLDASDLSASDLRALTISYAILTDKARLIAGEATSRTEHVTGEDARRRLSEQIEQLAKRRSDIAPTPEAESQS